MKKPKRTSPFDEQPDPMRDLDIDLDTQDDEIIDLEDIIEMPSRSIDEDADLDMEVEILDVDGDLEDDTPLKPMQKPRQPFMKGPAEPVRPEEEELIKSFEVDSEEEDDLFGSRPTETAVKKTPVGEESRALADDDSLLDDLLDQPLPEFSAGKTLGEEPDAPPESAAAPRDVKAEVKAVQTEPTILEEAPEPPAPRQAAEPAAVSFVPAEESSLGRAADELMERMEARLQENMRLMVESSLPDLVRSILKEEIEKLKKEIL